MNRLFHALRGEHQRKEVLVVIWGVHSLDWMTALHPSSPVWKKIPQVGAVVHRSPIRPDVSMGARLGRRTVVIPLMEEHAAQRPVGSAALVPTPEALAILWDKGRFADFVRARGLSHLCPVTYASIEEANFPCVIKRTDLNTGRGVEIAASLEQARGFLENEPFAGHPCVVQAMTPFEVEYTIHCVCKKGRILWRTVYAFDFPEQQIRKVGARYTIRRATMPGRLMEDLEALLMPLEYSGPCNVDCTLGSDGRLVIFEINPRMGGSLMRPENMDDLAACLSVIIAEASSP